MGKSILNEDQRITLISLLGAGYGPTKIQRVFGENSWPIPSYDTIRWYQQNEVLGIQQAASERRRMAAIAGLAHREERILRLIEVAERIEESDVMTQDSRGRYPLLAEYRAYLDQIAIEAGQKITRSDITTRDVKELRITVERFTEQRKSLDDWMLETFGKGDQEILDISPRELGD